MGAQQVKTDDDLEGEPNIEVSQRAARELLNEIRTETVMSERNVTNIGTNAKRITVANFAKIKIEPRVVEEYSRLQSPSISDQNQFIPDETIRREEQCKIYQDIEEKAKVELKSTENQNSYEQMPTKPLWPTLHPAVEDNQSLVLNPFSCAGTLENKLNIEVKKELLESHVIQANSEKDKQIDVTFLNNTTSSTLIQSNSSKSKEIDSTFQNDTICTLLVGPIIENIGEIGAAVKTESIEYECIILENKDEVQPSTENLQIKEEIEKDNSFDIIEEDINSPIQENCNLVKNPFAYLKRSSNKKNSRKESELFRNKNKDSIVNKIIKSELDITSPNKSAQNTTKAKIILEEDTVQSSINLKELIIKSETLPTGYDYVDFYNNTDSNSSLDVNLSSADTDIEDVISNISLNSFRDSLKYSLIEFSSVENFELPAKESSITSTSEIREKPKPNKSFKRRSFKSGQKINFCPNSNCGRVQKKRGRKPKSTKTTKSKKYTEKDSPFKSRFSKKIILKNLPKTGIKTRKKENYKQITDKKSSKITPTKDDFPKPFKTEPPTMHGQESTIATELPKPMTFKTETDINVKNKNLYLKPKFQPCVRLKRLKSEELLVPIKTRRTRKRLSYQQETNETRENFLIQHAFSLNQHVKLNRLSIDNDRSYHSNHENNDQPSLYSRLTTPYSMPTDTPNESLAETDSKYFSSHELYSLFHSSTPDGSSMFSGNIDSGVSTSSPTTLQHHNNRNKTLLLEIAAERAFINYHLMYFGYSPIQFDLYNNLNDMNVFLKYLFGSVNMN